jgi:thymidylate kinase
MRRVVTAGVALGCLAMSGCGVADRAQRSVSGWEDAYRDHATMLLCRYLNSAYAYPKELIAISKILKSRGEDCVRFK